MMPHGAQRKGFLLKCQAGRWSLISLLILGGLALVFPIARVTRSVDAAEGGVIVGTVYFRGTPPPPKQMPIDKDNDICGTGFREWIDVSVGPESELGNIVVGVKGAQTGLQFEMPDKGLFKLNQKNCQFVPDIMIIPAGKKLKITNRDPIIHNIHTYEIIKGRRRDMFNFPQPERGHRRTELIKPRRGNTIELTCDIHSFMHGWIYVSDGSDCMVSTDGHYTIRQVPDGVYTVSVWHPTLGEQEVEVTMEGAQEVRVDFEFSATD